MSYQARASDSGSSATGSVDTNPPRAKVRKLNMTFRGIDSHHFHLISNREDISSVLVGSICRLTVYAFAVNYPPAKRWMDVAQFDGIRDSISDTNGLSGLSLCMFPATLSKEIRVTGSDRRNEDLWTWLFLHMRNVRTTRYSRDWNGVSSSPLWLRTPGGSMKSKLEYLFREISHYRRSESIYNPTDEKLSTVASDRSAILRVLLRVVNEQLTGGRNHAKTSLFNTLMFLVSYIQKRGRVRAKNEGYSIEMMNGTLSEMPDQPIGSSWNIPSAIVGDISELDLSGGLSSMVFKEMCDNFPAMRATLKYPILVDKPVAHDDDNSVEEYTLQRGEATDLLYHHTEVIQFHEVARKLLIDMACYSGDTSSVCIQSIHMFRAIHIIALGLRCLVARVVGSDVTEAEMYASAGANTSPSSVLLGCSNRNIANEVCHCCITRHMSWFKYKLVQREASAIDAHVLEPENSNSDSESECNIIFK